nr:immunoglobulin light chain junction region [Macaca mulatta]MOW74563.1 immunoglobulin light chain junction region [Macaca mulatta]
CQQHNSSPYSF